MADRSVRVRLQAEVSNYIAGLRSAAAATRDLAGEIAQEAADNQQAWTEVGAGVAAVGGTAALAFSMAANAAMEFESQMSGVKAATGATASEMDDLKDAALDAGAQTVFSATEAAAAQEALAKAGVEVTDILGGALDGALALAAAGQLEVADAAEIAATAMTQFGLSGRDVPRIADLLAAGAGKAQGEVSDLGAALGQVGLVADQTGLDVTETTAALAAFASAGLIGSDAGTSFKAMLQRLTPQSREAAELMQQLGFSAYDSQGQFIGLSRLAEELRGSFAGMTVEQRNAAMGTIFGSDAIRAAAVLYDQGAAGVAEWTTKVNDSGYAAETAAEKTDNLQGDLERLRGSMDTNLIKTGEQAQGTLRYLAQGLTGLSDAYGNLPGPVHAAVAGVVGTTAAVGIAAGAFALALPRLKSFGDSLSALGPRSSAAVSKVGALGRAAGGPLAVGLAVATIGAIAWGNEQQKAAARAAKVTATVEGLTAAIEADSGALGENTRAQVANTLEKDGLLKQARELGISLSVVTDAAMGNSRALQIVADATADAGVGASVFRERVEGLAGHTDEATEAARRNAAALQETGQTSGSASDAAAELAGEQAAAAREAEAYAQQLAAVNAELLEQANQALGLRGAQIEFRESVREVDAALAEHGATLDSTTAAGDANARVLNDIAANGNAVTQALIDQQAPHAQVQEQLNLTRDALVRAGTRFGYTEEAARAYADEVMFIPDAATTQAIFNDAAAREKVRDYTAYVKAMMATAVAGAPVGSEYGGLRRAGGGWVYGAGGPTDDRVPLMASPGEYVVNAADAAENAELLEAINAGRTPMWAAGEDYARGATVLMPTASPPAAPSASRSVHVLEGAQVVIRETLDAEVLARRAEFEVMASGL